jgi:hypothetical protein
MKKPFTITLNVMAYSQQDAEAKVDLLVQMGAFVKDLNVNNLAGSIIKSFIVSKIGELTEKKKLDQPKKKSNKPL